MVQQGIEPGTYRSLVLVLWMMLRLFIVFEIVKSLILVKRILELKKFPKLDIKKQNQTILIFSKKVLEFKRILLPEIQKTLSLF